MQISFTRSRASPRMAITPPASACCKSWDIAATLYLRLFLYSRFRNTERACMFGGWFSVGKTAALCGVVLLAASARSVSRPDEIAFEKHTIDLGSAETAVFADINRDGKLDLVSGENWYEAPHWIKHRFREIDYTNYYVDDLSTLPLDVDGDGYVDLVTSGW